MSEPTQVLMDAEALEQIKKGVEAIYEPVRRTFGKECGTTLMYRTHNRGPRNVDDGYWTAESVVPKNPFARLAAEFFKEGTKRTNLKVGDGTSGTTILAGVLFKQLYAKIKAKMGSFKVTSNKVGVMEMKRDILKAADEIKLKVKESSKKIESLEDLEKIAAISLGEDNDISRTVAKLCYEVGVDGFVDVVEGYKGEVEVEKVEGMRFKAKIADRAFVNRKERFEMEIEDSPVFITNYKLDNPGLVNYLVEKYNTPKLIMIAPDFSPVVLAKMALSFQAGVFVYPVKVPSLRTEQLEDMAVFCDAKLINKSQGMKLEDIQGDELGFLDKLTVKDVESGEDAVALGGRGEKLNKVQVQIDILKGQLEETKEPQFKALMERRISSLASKGGIIRVGASTEAESLPLKLKVEDVKFACRAALRGGYVKGGGLCLKEIAETLPDDHVLKQTLFAPHEQIKENAGGDIEIPDDVIDPAEAIYYAVEHATSVVASLITVKTLVVEEDQLQTGEGEMAMARAFNKMILAWKQQQGIMSESEKAMMDDARMGMTEDEYEITHRD